MSTSEFDLIDEPTVFDLKQRKRRVQNQFKIDSSEEGSIQQRMLRRSHERSGGKTKRV